MAYYDLIGQISDEGLYNLVHKYVHKKNVSI